MAAIVLLVTAGAIWAYWLWPFDTFDTRELQRVEGIVVQVVSVRATGPVLRVRCRVANRGKQTAQQVVLTARVVDPHGKVLAVNPLASVSRLQPGTNRETEIPIPGGGHFTQYRTEVEPTLVNWQ